MLNRRKIESFFRLTATSFLLVCCLQVQNAFAAKTNVKHITVFAESNMAYALTKIARDYSKDNNVIVSINFGSPAELISAIDAGEPADIFISAHLDSITTLQQKGLVDIYNILTIAVDTLALVTNAKNPNILPELQAKNIDIIAAIGVLSQNKMTLVTDRESSSLGKYTANLIKDLPKSQLNLFKKLEEDRSPIINSIYNNIDYYAILLNSQVENNQSFKIIAKDQKLQISYQALIIAGDNMENSRKFAKFLNEAKAKGVFKKSGFGDSQRH